ncbi:Fic family protein [Sphingobacterium phlebotomi]|uniref:Fic family protein n=1 Tax=Sphingobacterium phlebotomi TaxID=2605433 RepID=A0A5D4H5J8_9SPHI|nr:Fic family protein [Sphingobacterium phlebotomi]TYR36331.1 Fic family protein [Sphingobacterium phlebotomi]
MQPIEEALALKEELDALRPLTKEQEDIIMQKFRLDWNYNSNNLEGNSLTYGETKALLLHGITAQGKPLKDHFEITGHDEAIKWIEDLVKGDYPLTENFIRELHTLLLKSPYEVKAITPDGQPTTRRIEVGQYKTAPNHVKTKTGEIFRFATPEETPAKMHDLLTWYHTKSSDLETNPIILASEFHYRFIRIHPFDDGNGRTARILMNFILMKYGYPPVIIRTEDKENYFFALQQADAGIIEPFITYISQNLIRSLQIMISGAKGESINEPDDIDKEIALLEHRLKSSSEVLKLRKTKEVLLDVYDNSVAKLWNAFLIANRKFDRFYIHTKAALNLDAYRFESNTAFVEGREILERYDDHTAFNRIYMEYRFERFNRENFRNFDYYSIIIFHFDLVDGYSVEYQGKKLKKKYGMQLTEKEVESIITTISKAHTEHIEKEMK